jgi:hypothetical protein
MNKKVIYIGLGAVVAYLLYKKFVASNTKTTEAEGVEEEAAEEAPAGGGGGGGGGGTSSGAEAAPSANTGIGGAVGAATSMKKTMATKELGNIKPSSVMSGITAVKKPRNFGTAQRPSKPLTPIANPQKPIARPKIRPASNQRVAKFAGFLDLDSQDIQGQMM